MDKVAEKFGVFDLLVTTFPGAFFLFISKNLYCYFSDIVTLPLTQAWDALSFFHILSFEPHIPRTLYEFISFTFLSYFIGFLLQGVASYVKAVVFIHGKPHHQLFDISHGPLDRVQLEKFTPLFKSIYQNGDISSLTSEQQKKASKMIFHSINASCQASGIANRYVKLNVLSNMSFNIFTSSIFLILFLCLCYLQLLTNKLYSLMILLHFPTITLFICAFVFCKHGITFYKRWVVHLLYAYASEHTSNQ